MGPEDKSHSWSWQACFIARESPHCAIPASEHSKALGCGAGQTAELFDCFKT